MQIIETYINWIIRINYVFWISVIRYFITYACLPNETIRNEMI